MENLVPSHRVRPSVLLPLWKVAGFVLGQFFLARLYHYPALCHTSASRLYHYPALHHTSVSWPGFTTTLPCAIPLLVANCSCHCMKVGCTSGLWWPCIVFKSQNNWKYIFVHIFSLRTDQGNEHCQTTTSHRWWSSFHHLCVIRL